MRYVYGELDAAQAQEFEAHMQTCDECRGEVESYTRMRAQLLTPRHLLETTPSYVDEKILAAARATRQVHPTMPFFSVFVRKGVMTTLLFMVGFLGVGYMMFVAQDTAGDMAKNAHGPDAQANAAQDASAAETPGDAADTPSPQQSVARGSDSLSMDTSAGVAQNAMPEVPFSKQLGEVESDGVVPAGTR
jgi:anti-sigma factor RsiW